MRSITLEDLASLQSRAQTWAVCWMLQKLDGYDSSGAPIYSYLRQTGHDRDLLVSRTINGIDLSGTYSSFQSVQSTAASQNAGLEVDNLDVDVLLTENGITQADIRAGLFDNMTCTLFLVNWSNTSNSGIVVQHGKVGNFRAFVDGLATGELRGIKQALQQIIVDAVSITCRYVLGDDRCKVDIAALTIQGTVTSVTSRRIFEADLDLDSGDSPGDFVGGLVISESGPNEGFQREVKQDSAGSAEQLGSFELFEPFPYPLAPFDVFLLQPGCDKLFSTCRDRYQNEENFGGEPYVPGMPELLRGAE